jgi:hypothetical protein
VANRGFRGAGGQDGGEKVTCIPEIKFTREWDGEKRITRHEVK